MSINQVSIFQLDVPFCNGEVEIIETNHFFGVDDNHYHVDKSMNS